MRKYWVPILVVWSFAAILFYSFKFQKTLLLGFASETLKHIKVAEEDPDCASTNFEFHEEMSLWSEYLKSIEDLQQSVPLKKRSSFTVLATFPNSGTGMIQDFMAQLTNTCKMTVYGSECKDRKLPNPLSACIRVDAAQASWAAAACLREKGIRHVPHGLVKSHLNLQNSCQGVSYKHDAAYFNRTMYWRTKQFGKILHLMRNPWDNVLSRANIKSSRLCQDSHACDGILVDVRLNKSIGMKKFEYASEEVEISVLRLIAVNDFISWLAYHHQLALRIQKSNYQHLTVLYDNVVSSPLNMTSKIARFIGHKEDDLHTSEWDEWWRENGKVNLKNRGRVCKDGRVVPVKLHQMPKAIRLEINSRFRAYLDDDPIWMEPVSSVMELKNEVKFTEEFKRAFHFCFET